MIPSLEDFNWRSFLARPRLPSPDGQIFDALYRQPILITGAGGSIGSALASRLAILSPPALLLLEASESRLYTLKREWTAAGASGMMTPVLGNAADVALVEHIFATHRPSIVFHAAAFKHVPLMEEQPLAAIANNIFATETLTMAAATHGTRFILVSTDKAVEPASVMGATKRVAEQIVLAAGGTVLRLGNVLASRDSVAELFAQQIAMGGPITVTDPAARRYFLTLDEAVNLLLITAALSETSALLAPVLPASHYISDLAHFMVHELSPEHEIAIDFTQPRPGDKVTEQLWSAADPVTPVSLNTVREPVSDASAPAIVSIQSNQLSPEQLGFGLENLRAALEARNLAAALLHLSTLVPDYTPGEAVLALSRQQGSQVSL
ncbi:MAG: polysaccharide biosynthesis protein [Terracidiphilus sp.]